MRKNCLFMIMFAEGVQKGKIPPCRIGYLISVSNRDTNKSRVPNTFWTPSSHQASPLSEQEHIRILSQTNYTKQLLSIHFVT